ncbi:MAG: Ppx/GppA family phosphatase [Gammaproteobacteria bacterium]|nr:Ppx/GppA family phosphatase [Gammaproteobacteria bacterium]
MSSGRVAALDLGSNSFHLLIARIDSDKIRYLDRHKEVVRLAEGLDDKNRLRDEVADRAFAALHRFAEIIDGIEADSVRVAGTNTLRTMRNGDKFLEKAESILGVPINIISGIEEARLIYLGVTQDLAPSDERRLVVDIGGGSTELIVGKGLAPKRLESVYMGCVVYSGRFFKNKKISQESYDKALRAARRELRAHADKFSAENWGEAVGSSGTIRTVGEIVNHNWPDEHDITLRGLEKLAKRLVKSGHADAIDLAGLKEDRRPVIAGGVAILHAVFLELGIERMQVSSYAMKEGIIHDLAGRVRHSDARDITAANMMANYHVDSAQAKQVEHHALALLKLVKVELGVRVKLAKQLLAWAAKLHEIGLTISHSGFQKHGAYIILNADMLGFSKLEQKQISFLVLNQRRRLRAVAESYHFTADWVLVLVFRLACLFCRSRQNSDLPEIQFKTSKKKFTLKIDDEWLAQHPLTREDLEAESHYWLSQDIQFKLSLLSDSGESGQQKK